MQAIMVKVDHLPRILGLLRLYLRLYLPLVQIIPVGRSIHTSPAAVPVGMPVPSVPMRVVVQGLGAC